MIKYFRGLDTLRAIAALVVVWWHIETLKKFNAIPNLIDSNFTFFPNGHIAVVLFFVISGFLITYILTKEKENTGTISLKNFYMRRILRICPLYFLILLLSYVTIHTQYAAKTVFLCLSIFPNVANAIGKEWPSSPQIWSIGVEEQFYLLWPFVVLLVPKRKMIWILLLFFIGYSIFPHFLGYINQRAFQNEDFSLFVTKFFYITKFNCLAIGAIMGYALAMQKKWINFLSNNLVLLISSIASIGLWFVHFEFDYFSDEFYSVLFSIMIIGIINHKKINIDTSFSRFIGKISYGIYMYHWIIILFVLKFLSYNGNQISFNILLYLLVFAATIFISWISYITFERFFLKLKKEYKSGLFQ